MRLGQRGFSMMEVTLSVMLVGLVLAAALNTVAGAKAATVQQDQRAVGGALCESLMSEVLSQQYADSDEGRASFGLRSGEEGIGFRALFDDVDDYDGWSASPPQEKDGSSLNWAGGYERTVTVTCVRPGDYAKVTPDGVALKKITVVASLAGRPVYTLEAYASPLWPDPREQP